MRTSDSSKADLDVGIVNDTLIANANQTAAPDWRSPLGEELLTVHQAARVLNVSVSWVYEHTRTDSDERLPCVKLGKYLRFDQRDLHAYIDAKRAASRCQPRRRAVRS
jgi:excisionase family DNA binding protein